MTAVVVSARTGAAITAEMATMVVQEEIDALRGMDITIVTSATTNEGGYALLDAFGFPFKKGADAENAPRKKRRKRPLYGKKSK